MDCVWVEFEAEGFQKKDVVAHHILVGEVKLVNYDGIHVIVAQQII